MQVYTKRPVELVAIATATNGVATATAADPGDGQRHYITHIHGSFASTTAIAGTVTLDLGATSLIYNLGTDNKFTADFTSPVPGDFSTAITLALSDGGSGVVGNVVMLGYTY